MAPPQSPGPLAGVRIADLTAVLMGPMATRALADLGADVIKIEAPEGDMLRNFDPKKADGMSAFFLTVNRNKRSIVLDLKTAEGRETLLDLVATCDVFVSNLRPRALASLGLTDEAVRARRPDIVYCSATGFGQGGPYAPKAAYDDVIQAGSGMADMAAVLHGSPAYLPAVEADKIAALHVTQAILAALYRRAATGQGDFVEVPMAESLAAFNLVDHLQGHAYVPPVGDLGYARLKTPHRRPRRSADGWVCILPYDDRNWRDFFRLGGRPELADDERFATLNTRVTHVDALYGLMDELVATRTTAEWMELCDAHSIPAVPVVTLAELADGGNPHFDAVELVTEHEHPTEGRYRAARDPLLFASGSPGLYRHAPTLGQHTAEVLAEIGRQPPEAPPS